MHGRGRLELLRRPGLAPRFPLDRLEQETTAIARELAEGPMLVLGYTKVDGRAWMADAAGNQVPASVTGGLSFAANRGFYEGNPGVPR
jgi:hypothetical protein